MTRARQGLLPDEAVLTKNSIWRQSVALRLHVDVPQSYRTPLERAMRSSLELGFQRTENLYEDCVRFVREAPIEVARPKRGAATSVLIATWVLGVVGNGESLIRDPQLVAELAQVYENEVHYYWVSADAV